MPDQQEDRIGQQIGEYHLMRKLGSGGFGSVYLAEHIYERTLDAVKVLDIQLTKPEDFKDFLNEVRTVLLRHPHIVPLLDFGISRDGLPFLTMEYAPKGTLRDRHPKGARVPLSTIVSYVDQLASALQYAHNRRVVHRDIKPENILVRADRTLLVSDFGIAKLMEQNVLLSAKKQVGTPVYMAPEQHLGSPCFASDQYALAVVVYEWICGVRPFQGSAVGLAAQHMHNLPPPLRDHLPTLPEAVEHVIFKALAKGPEDRFESIQAFADAFREAVLSSSSADVLYPPIEAISTTPLVSSGPASSVEPESLVPVRMDAEAGSLEPEVQTADIPMPQQGVEVKLQEEPSVSVVQNTALLSRSTPHPPPRVMTMLSRQNPTPGAGHGPPLWMKILAVVAIFGLVVSLGVMAFFATHIGNNSSNRSNPNSKGISIINKPNNEQIGISDGTYAFDTGTDRVDASLKIEASKKLAQGDKAGAMSRWNQAVGKIGNDTSDAEALIYLENQRVLASGLPYVTLVAGTMLTGDASNIGPGRKDLQGAYVAQKEYNDGMKLSGGRQVRLLIANAGSKPDYVTEVAKLIVQATKLDKTIVGVMGWSRSAYAQKAVPVLAGAHIPLVSSTASADNLSGISPYFFRVVSSNKSQAAIGVKYAEQELHASRVALFTDPQNSYTNSLATDFSKQFVADGNQLVDTEKYTVGDKTNLPAHLQSALNFNPDLIYFSGYADDMAVLLVDLPASQPNLQVLGGECG